MKNGEKYNSRREFLKVSLWAGLALPFLQFCQQKLKTFALKLTGTNHILGHRLWAKNFPKPSETINTKYLIIGGGITGLSACRYLRQQNMEDFLLVEMESEIGGNSSSGKNKISAYPLGAHYLPLPNKDDYELIQFLKESQIYVGDDANGLPILDDYQLTYAPHERLFHKNRWHESLLPQSGISAEIQSEMQRFFRLMDDFRKKKGQDGKYWFDIPISQSSQDEDSKILDQITFKNWLNEQQFSAPELLWYLDYSCRDDFGLGIQFVSAWAGIHYFAGRKNNWATNRKDQVFTWAEGNSRLAKHLSKYSENKTLNQHLAYDIHIENDEVSVLVFDDVHKKSKKIKAEKVLMATPQFVNQYLFKNRKFPNFEYAPWILAIITLQNNFSDVEELAWDNVIYGSEGLGYIYNQHQNIHQNTGKKSITYYRSFSTENSKKSRKWLYEQSDESLQKMIVSELKVAHPLIENFIEEIHLHRLGHGMISPIPNHIFGKEVQKAKQPLENKIFFAHSDLSGISIFEEAFHQGINGAKAILKIQS